MYLRENCICLCDWNFWLVRCPNIWLSQKVSTKTKIIPKRWGVRALFGDCCSKQTKWQFIVVYVLNWKTPMKLQHQLRTLQTWLNISWRCAVSGMWNIGIPDYRKRFVRVAWINWTNFGSSRRLFNQHRTN